MPVVAFEIDTRLKDELSKIENLEVIYGDFLNVDLNSVLSKYNYEDDNFYSKIDKVIEESEDDKINCEIIGEDNFIDYSKSYSLYISDIIC